MSVVTGWEHDLERSGDFFDFRRLRLVVVLQASGLDEDIRVVGVNCVGRDDVDWTLSLTGLAYFCGQP